MMTDKFNILAVLAIRDWPAYGFRQASYDNLGGFKDSCKK